jgi:hypothetical protein
LRIPAEDWSRREGSLLIATVDVPVGRNCYFERVHDVLDVRDTPPNRCGRNSIPIMTVASAAARS